MGFTEILTIIFILLKVFNIVDWNWFIVLLPEIIGFIFYFIALICILMINRKTIKEFNNAFEKDDK